MFEKVNNDTKNIHSDICIQCDYPYDKCFTCDGFLDQCVFTDD